MSVQEYLLRQWSMQRNIIIQLGIDPDQDWYSLDPNDKRVIAQYLGVNISEL